MIATKANQIVNNPEDNCPAGVVVDSNPVVYGETRREIKEVERVENSEGDTKLKITSTKISNQVVLVQGQVSSPVLEGGSPSLSPNPNAADIQTVNPNPNAEGILVVETVKITKVEFVVYEKTKFNDLPQEERMKRVSWLRYVVTHVSGLLLLQFFYVVITINPGTHCFFGNVIAFVVFLVLGFSLLLSLMKYECSQTTFVLNYVLTVLYMICQAHMFAFLGCLTSPLNVILITSQMAALSIGMTAYIWIVKDSYSFAYAFLPGIGSLLILFFIIGGAWSWSGAAVSSVITIVLLGFFFYENLQLISYMDLRFKYNIIMYPVIVLYSSCIMVIVLAIIFCFRFLVTYCACSLCLCCFLSSTATKTVENKD